MKTALHPFLTKNFLAKKLGTLPLRNAVTIRRETPLNEALHQYIDRKIGSLLVVESDNLTGIVTERDLVMKLDPFAPSPRTMGSLMTPNPQTLPPHASVARLLHTFSAGGFRHIPIRAPGSPELQVCSVRDVIDYIYQRLAKRFLGAEFDAEEMAKAREVQKFFESPVTILRPHATYTVLTSSTSYEALALLRSMQIGSLVVVDAKSCVVGIVTERDFLVKVLAPGRDARTVPVTEVMTANPATVLSSSSVSRALSFLSEGRFRHLPVVDHAEQLVGMVSVKNFISFLAESIIAELNE